MKKIVIASHGDFSKGLLSSIEMIVGKQENIKTYSLYPGETPEQFTKEVEEEILKNKEDEFIIMTDLLGGSVHTAMTSLCKFKNVHLISGVSLNLALEILTNLDEEDLEETIKNALSVNLEQITYILSNNIKVEEGEEEIW